jgi:phenylpropionate dioxygenase-like ring-hydroxylating dioxygenase large terminal subunit
MNEIRDQWYVAAASSQVGSGPRAVRVLGLELALFRDPGGQVRALLDRCPHRGVRLSLGRMTEGALACAYHGWRFDGSGACVHIPSLVHGQRIAQGCAVPSFRTLEQDGYVWIWVGDADPGSTLPPRIPGFAQTRWVQGSVEMQCDALKMIENNVDWCHPYFAHPKAHTQYFVAERIGFRDNQYEMRVHERGLVVFAPVTASEHEPIPDRPLIKLTYELPGRVTVEMPSRRGKRIRIVMHIVPTGSSSCRLEWLYEPNPIPLMGGRVLWSAREPKIIRQDRELIESSQTWYDNAREDECFERSVEADAATLLIRRIHDMAVQGTWQQKWSSLPKRRVVDIRS